MFLIINTAEKNKTTLIFFTRQFNGIFKYSFKRNYNQAEKLLPAIDKLFKKNKKNPTDLNGLAIITGPGPFTALRVGITIANTMAFALKIPIVGIRLDEFKNTKEFIKLSYKKFRKTIRHPAEKKIVIPFYGKEPNITK